MELTSYKYTIPYLIFFGYLLILMLLEWRSIKRGKSIQIIHWLTMGGFIFFFGLRGFVSTDFINYYPQFKEYPIIWKNFNFSHFQYEPGFLLYTIICKSICPNYFFWIFISTAIDIIILNIFFKRYAKYYVFAFIMFFVFGGETLEFNLMRNVKAIMCFLLSIKYIEEKKPIKYILLNLLGISFHTSSILFLPLYLILNKVWSKKLLIIIGIIGVFINIFQIEYIKPILQNTANLIDGNIGAMIHKYLNKSVFNRPYGFTFGQIERIITFALVIVLYEKIIKQKSRVIFVNLFVLYFCSFFYMNELTIAVERVSILFICGCWVLYPIILEILEKRINYQLFLTTILILSMSKAIKTNQTIQMKYSNLLFGIENYEVRKNEVMLCLEPDDIQNNK